MRLQTKKNWTCMQKYLDNSPITPSQPYINSDLFIPGALFTIKTTNGFSGKKMRALNT